ncbi:MAG: radical SAM protein [Deltaproteobacteria bacterium]|nr:radical SAM protein [Deltaproteobacteria bacterium]
MIKSGIRLTSIDYMMTRGCNFECTWCFAGSGPLQKEYLPFQKLASITQEAAKLGVTLFILTGGEPLVYRDPALGQQKGIGDHFFRVVKMIRDTYSQQGLSAKILTFDDVALISPEIAKRFAEYEIGLCTKGDTLAPELQDYKVNQVGAFDKMQRGYKNLVDAGYGRDPRLRVVVNSVLDHTTFDGMLDLHLWVMENGFDHSIVPVHYCGNAENEDQEAGVHSPHVKVLYDVLSEIDRKRFGIEWKPWSAFPYNKTCNRNRSGIHIRANGDVTACSESPGPELTGRYTFGNIFAPGFSLEKVVKDEKLEAYREEFKRGYGTFVCSPEVCDLYAHDLCLGGCATRSAYSKIDIQTGLVVKNENFHNYSEKREDPLCPAWTLLAMRQGILREGLLDNIRHRIISRSTRLKDLEGMEHSIPC